MDHFSLNIEYSVTWPHCWICGCKTMDTSGWQKSYMWVFHFMEDWCYNLHATQGSTVISKPHWRKRKKKAKTKKQLPLFFQLLTGPSSLYLRLLSWDPVMYQLTTINSLIWDGCPTIQFNSDTNYLELM